MTSDQFNMTHYQVKKGDDKNWSQKPQASSPNLYKDYFILIFY